MRFSVEPRFPEAKAPVELAEDQNRRSQEPTKPTHLYQPHGDG